MTNENRYIILTGKCNGRTIHNLNRKSVLKGLAIVGLVCWLHELIREKRCLELDNERLKDENKRLKGDYIL